MKMRPNELGMEDSKEEDLVELSNDERPVSKKSKLIWGNRMTRTRYATKVGGGGTSTFTLEDNPVDSVIRDLEGVWSRIAEYELQMQQVGEMVGSPPWENLVVAIQEVIKDPRRLRELEGKVDHFTMDNKKPRSNCGSWRRSDMSS